MLLSASSSQDAMEWMEQQINKQVQTVLLMCCGANFQYVNVLVKVKGIPG